MINKSYQLIRTNPRLTTNIKFVVSSDYNLYLESFNSSKTLSDDKYKHYLLSISSMVENDLPKFYDKLPKNIAFSPKLNDDAETMYNSYDNQFDDIYFSGADEVEDKWYNEEFEYLAPLYVVKNQLPSNFIIMRVNDAAIYNRNNETIDSLTKSNFRTEIIDKWKCISVFDLSKNTNFGKFLDRNINTNDRFPDYSLFFDIKKYNFSKFSGLEYTNGIYGTSEIFLNDFLEKEKTHFNFEEFITKQYENLGIIYPYIFNFKYLFNDDPATPDKFLKYTMNRYYGFYTNSMDLVKSLTSYNLPTLKPNLTIKNNIFLDSNGIYTIPFSDKITDTDWVQVDNDFYEVRKQSNGSYKIISDRDLTGYDVSKFNSGVITITDNTITDFGNIDSYITPSKNDELMYADLYLIEIDGIYHVLKNKYSKIVNSLNETIFTNNYYIDTDYNIISTNDILEYYKGGKDSKYYNQKTIFTNKPLSYNIYRVNFSDIKDFDFDRINTSYSDFDYEKSVYVDTLETKLSTTEYRDVSTPQKRKVHNLKENGQYKLVNVSSEYTANDETFEIRKNGKLNPLWEKNQTINKWTYTGSISHSDYPYKLNNSDKVGGKYNRTTNTESKLSNIVDKNLDYFYRIGELYGKDDLPIINGFDNINSWTLSIGNTKPEVVMTDTTMTVDFSGSLENQVTIDLNTINLQKNTDYYVSVELDITNSSIINNNLPYSVGFNNTTFDNGTIDYSILGSILLTFIGTSKNNILSLIVNNISNVVFKNLKIYKMVNKYYYNQSTNIQTGLFNKFDDSIDNRFNLDYYINSDFDYFEHFFNNIMYYDDYGKLLKKPFTKYSVFNGGTDTLPSSALFKGIEYKLFNVNDMVFSNSVGNTQKISNIITNGGKNFNGYKISVILSENYNYYKFKYSNIDTSFNKWSVTTDIGGLGLFDTLLVQHTDNDVFDISWSLNNSEITVLTNSISNLTDNSLTTGGNVTNHSTLPIISKGVCWSVSSNPSIFDDHTVDGSGSGGFDSNISGLTSLSTYYIKAYATNSNGTYYGNLISVTTNITPTTTTTTSTTTTSTTTTTTIPVQNTVEFNINNHSMMNGAIINGVSGSTVGGLDDYGGYHFPLSYPNGGVFIKTMNGVYDITINISGYGGSLVVIGTDNITSPCQNVTTPGNYIFTNITCQPGQHRVFIDLYDTACVTTTTTAAPTTTTTTTTAPTSTTWYCPYLGGDGGTSIGTVQAYNDWNSNGRIYTEESSLSIGIILYDSINTTLPAFSSSMVDRYIGVNTNGTSPHPSYWIRIGSNSDIVEYSTY